MLSAVLGNVGDILRIVMALKIVNFHLIVHTKAGEEGKFASLMYLLDCPTGDSIGPHWLVSVHLNYVYYFMI